MCRSTPVVTHCAASRDANCDASWRGYRAAPAARLSAWVLFLTPVAHAAEMLVQLHDVHEQLLVLVAKGAAHVELVGRGGIALRFIRRDSTCEYEPAATRRREPDR